MNKKKIITHNAKFHADDVFSVAVLLLHLDSEAEIIRTRDEKIIETGDFVVDVGGVYEPENNRFDHHQIGGAGKRDNNIPYASLGLVWKKFGEDLCGTKEVAIALDEKLIQPIDAGDNGVDIEKSLFKNISKYNIGSFINTHRPTWKETQNFNEKFIEAVDFAKKILKREIKITKDWVEAKFIVVDKFKNSKDKRLVVFNKEENFGRELIEDVLVNFNEPLYAVLPRSEPSLWQVIAIKKEFNTFLLRKSLPKNWLGKKDEELQEITNVKDATFCHRKGFMCVVGSKEGAVSLVKKALEA